MKSTQQKTKKKKRRVLLLPSRFALILILVFTLDEKFHAFYVCCVRCVLVSSSVCKSHDIAWI